ncbi:MAG: tetratricopeptide repeat protein, partial [Bacteroidetes bacterium]
MKSIHQTWLILLVVCFSFNLQAQDNKKNKEKDGIESLFEELDRLFTRSSLTDAEASELENKFVEGMKFFITDEYEKAIDIFLECYQKMPQNSAISYQIALTYYKQNDFDNALDYAQKAIKLHKENPYYYALLADVYESLEQYEYVSEILTKLVKRLDVGEMYYFDLAISYLYQNKYLEAIEVYNQAEQKFGLNEIVVSHKQKIYISLNDLDGALKEGEKLIQQFPLSVEYRVAQAELLLNNKRGEEAKKILDDALHIQSDYPQTYLVLADYYEATGEKDLQIKSLELAFESPALDSESKLNVLLTYMSDQENKNLAEKGLKLAEIAVKTHPNDSKLFGIYGNFQLILEKPRLARAAYQKAVSLDPNNYRLWEGIVQIDSDLNEADSLIKNTDRAIEYFPNQAVFWFYNGRAHFSNKNYTESVQSLEQCRLLSQENTEMQFLVYAHLGDAYNGMKEYHLSDKAYENALEIRPNDSHILNNYSYYLSVRKEKLPLAKEMS